MRLGIKRGVQQLIQRHRIDAQDRGFLVDQAFTNHIDRHLQGSLGSALARSCLQHPQRALLHGEFDVLHVLVVMFQQVKHAG